RVIAGAREAAEAEPSESEVASPVGLIPLYSFKLDFVYSLSLRHTICIPKAFSFVPVQDKVKKKWFIRFRWPRKSA
ncbi:hypothetical protein ACTL32_18515, partial [Planococcus sp. FY231025]|uniref:hypothetical protein n=1 Tax=Planococcus sp. FY231025 TaxID=3455699 RepID=UPI003F911CC9